MDFEELPDLPDSTFCYKIVSNKLPWQNASKECEASGSYLVSVLNEEENEAIHKMCNTEMWLGLQDNRECYEENCH